MRAMIPTVGFRIVAGLLLMLSAGRAWADAAKPTFADDVLPVLRQSCLGCHSDDKQRGGLNLATFAATMQGGSSGPVVTPGNPDQSRLYLLTAHLEEPKMPPKADKIPAASLEVLKKWIEQGARENAASKVMEAKPAAVAAVAKVKGRPDGPPPMPGDLPREPVAIGRRAGAIQALAANPWSPVVAIGGLKQVLIYHADEGYLLGVLPFPAGQVNHLKFSRNGKMLLAAGGRGGASGRAILYDLAIGKAVIEVGQETDAILAADISADQTMIAVGSPSKIVRMYSTADGSLIREIKKHTDWVTAVEFSPDGVLLASGDRNGGLFVWEAGTGREFHTLRGPTAAVTDLSWRDDSNVLAVASEDSTLRLFEMENGAQIKNWGAHGGGVAAVKFAHDGRLVSIGRDRTPKLWDGNGGQQRAFEPFPDLGLRVAVTHDGSRVIAGDWTGQVRVWTISDGQPAVVLDANPPSASERLARAEKAVAEWEAKVNEASATVAAAKASADKANAELSVFQKAATDAAAASKAAQDAVPAAKAELDKQTAALTAAQTAEAAKVVAHQSLQEAAAKVQNAANQQPENAELKAQAAKVAEIAKAAASEVETARKATAAIVPVHKAAAEKHAAAQKAAADAAAALPAAQQKLAAEQAARKPVLDAFATAQASLKSAESNRAKARTMLERERASSGKK